MRRRLGRVLAAAVLAVPLVVALAACGGTTSDDGTVIDGPPAITTLVGTWTGTLDGGSGANSYGTARITIILRADSTFTAEADNPLYCSLNNTKWSVSPAPAQFTATGRDCTGTGITLVAPVAPLRLNGTWTATSGRAGTFTVGRE